MTDDLDVCPTCKAGRYDPATGVVNLSDRCCCVYFYGPAHGETIWREYGHMMRAKIENVVVTVKV